MATQSASSAQSASIAQSGRAAVRSASAISVRPPRSVTQRWLFAAFLLAGAAQLITISALLSADPLAATWWALLLAIAPVLLAAAAAFLPAGMARLAAVAATVVLIVGIVGTLLDWPATSRVGPLFIPALVAVVVGGMRLWRARAW